MYVHLTQTLYTHLEIQPLHTCAQLKTLPIEVMEIISIQLMKYARTVAIFYSNRTALSLNTVIPHPHSILPQYSQRGHVNATETTLKTRAHLTVPHERFYCRLHQNHFLRLAYRRVIVFISTKTSNNAIIPTAHARGSRVDYLSVKPLIMVARPTVDSNVDTSDRIVAG